MDAQRIRQYSTRICPSTVSNRARRSPGLLQSFTRFGEAKLNIPPWRFAELGQIVSAERQGHHSFARSARALETQEPLLKEKAPLGCFIGRSLSLSPPFYVFRWIGGYY